MIKVGDLVDTKFGVSEIIGIELCENIGDKYGIPVEEIEADLKDYCVFDLENGHWQRGLQITLYDKEV